MFITVLSISSRFSSPYRSTSFLPINQSSFLYSICTPNNVLFVLLLLFETFIPLSAPSNLPIFTFFGLSTTSLVQIHSLPSMPCWTSIQERHSESSELAATEQDDLANTTYPRNWIYKVNPLQPSWAVATANFIIVSRLMVETGLRLKKFRQINAPGWGLGML